MNRIRKQSPFRIIIRAFFAVVLTAGLLVFLAGLRLAQQPVRPELTIRTLESVDPVSLPAPPPPPPAEKEPPPPPPKEALPRLELALDPVAPPIKARIDQDFDLRLPSADFARRVQSPRAQMTFFSHELDNRPKLINRPAMFFPKSLSDRGVTEGKVTLEVLITSSGNVRVRRTLDSTHAELVEVARSFATESRFSVPNKDGRNVNVLFRWPLLLRQ